MKIELVQGVSAESLLASEPFQRDWSALWDQCPWATAFQKYGFARAWYDIYHEQLTPLLLLSRDAGGNLDGLLALARATDGRCVVAGGIHAEYQSWLSAPPLGDAFPAAAFAALHRELHVGPVTFEFLSPKAPLQWLDQPEIKHLAFSTPFFRPVLEFGENDTLQQSLNKGHTKQKFRRLAQVGELSFTRITSPDEFAALFDQMVTLYDLRHGAVQATPPFCSIPRQRDFHLAMMRIPDLFHATALRAGDRLAAAHWGTCGKRELHMGTLVFEPSLVRHSPGRLLILRLAEMLKRDGFARLDLTPGGDAYKDLFASHMEPVYRLTILSSVGQRLRLAAIEQVRQTAARACRAMGTTPVQARVRWQNLPKPGQMLPCLMRGVGGWLISHRQTRVYYCPPPTALPVDGCPQIHRDRIDDLLTYQTPRYGLTRQQFLSTALQRLEENQHVYTAMAEGKLLHLAWVAEQPEEQQIRPWLTTFPLPPQRILVHDLAAVGPTPDWNLAETLLRRILHDAARQSPAAGIFLSIPGDDADQLRLIKRNGFAYLCAHQHRVVMGRHRDWIDNPHHPATAEPIIPPLPPKPPMSTPLNQRRQLQPVEPNHD